MKIGRVRGKLFAPRLRFVEPSLLRPAYQRALRN